MSEQKAQTRKAVDVAVKSAPRPKAASKARATKHTRSHVKESGATTMPSKATAYKKIEASFEPVVEFNKMVAGSMESSYNIMMDSFQSYAKLGIDSMQSGLKVRSPEDMVSYFESQYAMTQKASDMLMSDAKTISDMGIKFFNDVRSLYESGMKTSYSAASEAMKTA
jgi:phasin family protein